MLFLGGLLFGYGMVMSNGCGSRALVLIGRGNLRSLVVVIVLAIFAQMTLKGLIAPAAHSDGRRLADHAGSLLVRAARPIRVPQPPGG